MSERRPRGRPRQFDKDEKLQIILKLFWRRGYAATSLDDLSAETGLSRPSLYAAYGDKTAMYAAALEAFGARMAEHAVPPLHDTDTLCDALRGFYSGALDVYFGDANRALGCLVFTTAIADAPREPAIADFVRHYLDRMDRALDACIQRCAPELPEDDRRRLAQFAGGILMNLATRARAGASRSDLDAIAGSSASFIGHAAREQTGLGYC